jgi:CRP-like cAMP-binding protein
MEVQLMNSVLPKTDGNNLLAFKVLPHLSHDLKHFYFKRYDLLPLGHDVLWQIKKGTVRTMTWSEDGYQVVLGLWGEGDIVGSSMSTIDPYWIQCLSNVEAVVLPSNLWHQASEAIISHCRQSEELLNILHCRTISTKLKQFLVWLSEKFGKPCDRGMIIDLRLTHQDIAETIGSTRVSMTKLLNQFKTEGLISWHKHYLIVHTANLEKGVKPLLSPKLQAPYLNFPR